MNDMDRFRANFSLVWKNERHYLNADEHEKAKAYAGRYVREHLRDANAMKEMMTHFASMADAIRQDQARSERIRAEMSEARRKAA